MKALVFGGEGTLGRYVKNSLRAGGGEVLSVGRSSGDLRADFRDVAGLRQVFEQTGVLDAVVSVAGEVAFKHFGALTPEDWQASLDSKFLGQVQLVREAIPHLRDGGSMTLMSGVLARDFVPGGVAASVINAAIESFVRAVANELPRGIRINVVSPTVIEDSVADYGRTFAGFTPTTGKAIALAYEKSIFGGRTGQVIEVG